MLERITDTVDIYVRAYPEQLTVMLERITDTATVDSYVRAYHRHS